MRASANLRAMRNSLDFYSSRFSGLAPCAKRLDFNVNCGTSIRPARPRASKWRIFTYIIKGYAFGQQHHHAVRRQDPVRGRDLLVYGRPPLCHHRPNGAGKTTLMKILEGEIEPTKGSVTRPKKIGILRQDQFAFDEFRVIDTVIMGNGAAVEGSAGARRALRKAARPADR